jgi:hypothetical protein
VKRKRPEPRGEPVIAALRAIGNYGCSRGFMSAYWNGFGMGGGIYSDCKLKPRAVHTSFFFDLAP